MVTVYVLLTMFFVTTMLITVSAPSASAINWLRSSVSIATSFTVILALVSAEVAFIRIDFAKKPTEAV